MGNKVCKGNVVAYGNGNLISITEEIVLLLKSKNLTFGEIKAILKDTLQTAESVSNENKWS